MRRYADERECRKFGFSTKPGFFARSRHYAAQMLEGSMIATALENWYGYMKGHDLKALHAMIHPDAVFESPVVHTPQKGRDIVFKYLASAEKVLGGPGFTYVGEWRNADSAILEFENVIDGIKINGVDMITWNVAGQIIHFKVMVRPLKAINMLHQKMGEMLAQL